MEAIVAVYADWGIGAGGTQPLALTADRKFFREMTKGAAVICGRRTLGDFPGGRPLPGRENIILSRTVAQIPGAKVANSPEAAAALAQGRAFVIGGASVYRQMLPWCTQVYVTKIDACPQSDVFFPNLDADPRWRCADAGQTAWENGVAYRFCRYTRVFEEKEARAWCQV